MSLDGVSQAFGGPNVLDRVSLSVERGLRAALTGRNGEGKSTLLKIMAGLLAPDCGEIVRAPGLKTVYVPQSVPADRPGDDAFNALSGGRRRKKMLEEAILSGPGLLLLDEPTNHLDTETIDWLEGMLRRMRDAAVVVVTHDRAFLRRVAKKIFDLDRGTLTGWDCDWRTFVERKARLLADEAAYWERKAKKLAQEEAWIRKGVKARTTRNEGRVAALVELRKEFASRRTAIGGVSLKIDAAAPGGDVAIKVRNVSFAYPGGEKIVDGFSANVLRGERIGILGPNGAGKTTLLNLLAGRLAPDSGEIVRGTNVKLAFFDQLRGTLDEEATVADNVARGAAEVEVRGVRRHVFSYLADFLFTSARARTPVKALSGGEKARLLLAKLFLEPSNLLVMDEPANDLDVETLELLEEQLANFPGTLLLVSHDREFLDNVVTSTFALEGGGEVCAYPGGYADWEKQRKARPEPPAPAAKAGRRAAEAAEKSDAPAAKKLSYKEKLELEGLPEKIDALEKRIAAILESGPAANRGDYAIVPELQAELDALVERWAALEERA